MLKKILIILILSSFSFLMAFQCDSHRLFCSGGWMLKNETEQELAMVVYYSEYYDTIWKSSQDYNMLYMRYVDDSLVIFQDLFSESRGGVIWDSVKVCGADDRVLKTWRREQWDSEGVQFFHREFWTYSEDKPYEDEIVRTWTFSLNETTLASSEN